MSYLRTSLVSVVLCVLLVVMSTSSAQAGVNSNPSIRDGVAAAGSSPEAAAVRADLATLLSDPAVPALASLLASSPNIQLSDFQRALLKAVIVETRYPAMIAALTARQPLSDEQRSQLVEVRSDLHNNPAIQQLISNGAQLKRSPDLSSDIALVATGTAASYTAPPSSGVSSLDAITADFSALRGSGAFDTFAQDMLPLLQNPGMADYLTGSPPETVQTFIPVKAMLALLLPNDRDPSLGDILKAALEIIGGIAAVGAAILLIPEEITAAVVIGITLAIIAGVSAILVGIIDLIQALGNQADCDNDGDPGDPLEFLEC